MNSLKSLKEIEIVDGWNARTEYTFKRKGKDISKEVYWYLAETEELDVALSHEHTNYLWLNFDDAKNQLTFDQEKEIINSVYIFRTNSGLPV